MRITKKKILIIGGGIHGCFLAYYLSKKNYIITIIEKNNDICNGSSAATHNRANRGFHYPRSKITSNECKIGWNFFYKNFKKLFKNIGSSYYLIEKSGKISPKKYKNFLIKQKYKFSEKFPTNLKFNKEKILSSYQVFEGCFDHKKVVSFLKKNLIKKKINIIKKFTLSKFYNQNDKLNFESKNKQIISDNFDIIINATYSDTNKIQKILNNKIQIKEKYKIQHTLIPIVISKKKIPAFTIMDGPFTTVMPWVGNEKKYLIYDVKHSNSLSPLSNKDKQNRYKLMLAKLDKYLITKYKLKLHGFLNGKRPVPRKDLESRRSTVIDYYKYSNYRLINIREGKYISAPLEMKKLASKINNI